MKKFILIIVFAVLIALFIAFNYLLWDRESKLAEIKNLESVNASYSASVSVHKREISTLEEEVNSLNNQITQYKAEIDRLQKERDQVISDKAQGETALKEKIDYINILKEHADIDFLAQPVILWAEALNNGSFDEAYSIEYEGVPQKERTVSLSTYVEQMKSTVEEIEITEAKVDRLRGYGNGDIYLNVRFNAKLTEDADTSVSRFTEGENDMNVKVIYSKDKKAFVISSMNIY
jgi:cell division protein FtsB